MAVEVARPEEVHDSLRTWMAERLRERSSAAIDTIEISLPVAPTAGQSNETLAFSVTWREGGEPRRGDYVLRRQPSTHSLLPEPDVLREFRVLQALEGTGVPAPRVIGAESDTTIQGVPFFVMERVPGPVPYGKPSIHAVGWLTTLTPVQRTQLWQAAIDALVAVHAVPWTSTHDFLAPPAGADRALAAHLERLASRYRWTTRGRSFPVTDAALDWLLAHLPDVDDGAAVLVWGDARVGNMIFTDELAVSAVIDWEFATVGPRELDVGYWLIFDEFLTKASGTPRLPGYPDRTQTIESYQRRTGVLLDHVEYFEVLAALFLGMTVIRQADLAVEQGRLGPETSMGHGNAFTQILADRLGLSAPDMSEDFIRHRQGSQPPFRRH